MRVVDLSLQFRLAARRIKAIGSIKGDIDGDEAKVKWDEKLVELESKRDTARAKLAEVGESSAEAWKDLQKGAQAAWNDMDNAFSEASREF